MPFNYGPIRPDFPGISDQVDLSTVAAPFRVTILNPDLEDVTVEITVDSGTVWEVLGTVSAEVGSIVVGAPVPKMRVQSSGSGDNVLYQISGFVSNP